MGRAGWRGRRKGGGADLFRSLFLSVTSSLGGERLVLACPSARRGPGRTRQGCRARWGCGRQEEEEEEARPPGPPQLSAQPWGRGAPSLASLQVSKLAQSSGGEGGEGAPARPPRPGGQQPSPGSSSGAAPASAGAAAAPGLLPPSPAGTMPLPPCRSWTLALLTLLVGILIFADISEIELEIG